MEDILMDYIELPDVPINESSIELGEVDYYIRKINLLKLTMQLLKFKFKPAEHFGAIYKINHNFGNAYVHNTNNVKLTLRVYFNSDLGKRYAENVKDNFPKTWSDSSTIGVFNI